MRHFRLDFAGERIGGNRADVGGLPCVFIAAVVGAVAGECGELDQKERHLRILPVVAPVLNQYLVIRIVGGLAVVVAALIPDDAAELIAEPGMEHPVEQRRRVVRRGPVANGCSAIDFGTDADFAGIRNKFCFLPPVCMNDTGNFGVRDREGDFRRRPSALGEMVGDADRERIASGFDEASRDGVVARTAPVVRLIDGRFTDLFAVEPGFVAVVHRAEMQSDVFACELRGDFKSSADDGHSDKRNDERKSGFFPCGIIEFRSRPFFRLFRNGASAGEEFFEPGSDRGNLSRPYLLEFGEEFRRGILHAGERQLRAVFFERLFGNPRLNVGSAPCCRDEADGNIEVLHQLASEEVAACAEEFDGFRRADLPAGTVLVGKRIIRAHAAHQEGVVQTDARVIGVRNFFFVIRGAPELSAAVDGHFHVGLSGAHPDFADENVVEHLRRHVVGSADLHGMRSARGHCGKGDAPFAVRVCRGRAGVPRKSDLYFRSRISDSGNDDGTLPLKNHVGAENFVR